MSSCPVLHAASYNAHWPGNKAAEIRHWRGIRFEEDNRDEMAESAWLPWAGPKTIFANISTLQNSPSSLRGIRFTEHMYILRLMQGL